MKPFSILPALVIVSQLAIGQVVSPAPKPASEKRSESNNTTSTRESSKEQDNPLGKEIPMLDPSAETVTVGGVTIPLGDNRVLNARFEKYLNQPPESTTEAAEYRANIRSILETISPFREGGPQLYPAFKILPRAAAYPGDAGICYSLAEVIYLATLAKKDVNGIKQLNASIEAEKQSIISRADWDARMDRNPGMAKEKSPSKEGSGEEKSSGVGDHSLRYKEHIRRIVEIEGLKLTNVGLTEAKTLEAKTRFQVSMVHWFIQRRYEHVLMASRFYNQIWRDGDSTLRIGENSEVSRMFSDSMGLNPTVSSLDSLSSEAIREVERYVEAFDLMLEMGNLHSASRRLMEAYALGEYLAPVATLPLEKKQKIADYVRNLHELYGTLQARDYTRAKELTVQLKASAKDFPSSKVDSAIAGYSMAADLAIEEAKILLLAKENDKAAEKIKAATEIWPTNPKLKEFSQMIGSAGPLVVARNDFDRLIAEKNYREIFKRQYELAPAIQGDAQREDYFQQVVTNIGKIEGALEKASEFSKMGHDYAAYEQLAELRETFPDDPKLGRQLELLAPKVADLTKALDHARQFEEKSASQAQPGSALAWYLKARNIFPRSKFADEGIKRMLDQILLDDTALPSAP